MSRILGVDYGERRIGLALSDPLGIIAKPLKVIDRKNTIDYLSAIIETAKERDVKKISSANKNCNFQCCVWFLFYADDKCSWGILVKLVMRPI